MIVCLNPDCQLPTQRCLDNRTIRTHPSDCARHYFSADIITTTPWTKIPDYPSDFLGISVAKKIGIATPSKDSTPVFYKIITKFKDKLNTAI
jgi:hypothetical protein